MNQEIFRKYSLYKYGSMAQIQEWGDLLVKKLEEKYARETAEKESRFKAHYDSLLASGMRASVDKSKAVGTAAMGEAIVRELQQ